MENTPKIRINRDNIYRIEINDEGDCIELDLFDIELPIKLANTITNLKAKDEEYKKKYKNLEKKYEGLNEKDKNILISRMKDEAELENNLCNDIREELDNLFGKGMSYKIFGAKNRYGEFRYFMEQFSNEISKIEVDMKKARQKLIEQYQEDREVL